MKNFSIYFNIRYLPRRLLDNLVVLHGICSLLVLQVLLVLPVLVMSLLMELLPLWFTKLMESMESDSELEELQDEPLPMESLLRSGLNRRYLNFILVSTSLDKFRHEIIGMDFDDQHYRLGHVYSVGCLGVD